MDIPLFNATDEDNPTNMSLAVASSSMEGNQIADNPLSDDFPSLNRDFKPGQQRHLLDLPSEVRKIIYSLVLEAKTPVKVRREYSGCPLTLVNRQLRTECLPLYLQWNRFYFDRRTDLTKWVDGVGAKNLMLYVDKLGARMRISDHFATWIEVLSLSAIEEDRKGITVLAKNGKTLAVKELNYEPGIGNLHRVVDRIVWNTVPKTSWLNRIMKPTKQPDRAFKAYVKRWAINTKALVSRRPKKLSAKKKLRATAAHVMGSPRADATMTPLAE